MKILYLTFLESITGNGIYDTQVKEVLCKLASVYKDKVEISHYALLPAVRVGRKGVFLLLLDERREKKKLKDEYRRHGVMQECIFLPVIILKRWGMHLRAITLGFLAIVAVAFLAVRMARRRPDVIHTRSYMAAVIAVMLKRCFPALRVVFDPRGFWPEEGVVERRWSWNSWTFRLWKRVEKWLFAESDRVIALSDSFAGHVRSISPNADCTVIYTSVDVEKFRKSRQLRKQRRVQLGFADSKVFVYNGSLGSWHDPVLLARIYSSLRTAAGKAKLVVITTFNKAKLAAILQGSGIPLEEFAITAAKPDEVAGYLAAADFGIVPLREIDSSESMRVVADTMIGTKVAEYLASGLPIIVNRKVQGIRPLMDAFKMGMIFDSDRLEEAQSCIEEMIQQQTIYQQNCDFVAASYFSLDRVTRAYFEVYEELVDGSCASRARRTEECPTHPLIRSEEIPQLSVPVETRLGR